MRGELFSNSHQQVGLSQWKDYTCPTQCNINLNLLYLLWILRGAFPSFKHTPFQINGSLSHFAFISGCTCVSIPFHLWRGTWRELMTAPHLVLQLHKKFSRGTEGQQCSSSDCDVITQIQILACGFKAQRCSKKRKRKKRRYTSLYFILLVLWQPYQQMTMSYVFISFTTHITLSTLWATPTSFPLEGKEKKAIGQPLLPNNLSKLWLDLEVFQGTGKQHI